MIERLRMLLTQDLGLKAVSLLLGTGIWFAVHETSLGTTRKSAVPVEISLPRGKAWSATHQPLDVRLKLAGPKRVIESIEYIPLVVRIPIPETLNPDGAQRSIGIGPEHLAVASSGSPLRGVTVESDPPEVLVAVDEEAEEAFPVRAVVADPPKGFKLGETSVNPPTVTVRGPKRLLEEAHKNGASLETRLLDPGYQREGNLQFPAEISPVLLGKRVSCSVDKVSVLLKIIQERETKRVEKIPLQWLMQPGFTGKVEVQRELALVLKGPATVKLRGGKEKPFLELAPEDITAYVTVPAKPGLYEAAEVVLQLPDGVSLAEPPPAVRLEVK